jgi:3-hydroxyisobutyrate dehydrogenase-like beta-hydroxyacid dehydrogenase
VAFPPDKKFSRPFDRVRAALHTTAVCGLNRSPARTALLIERCAVRRRCLTAAWDVVIHDAARYTGRRIRRVSAGGVAAGIPHGSTFVDMSTIDPAMSRWIAARQRGAGAAALDAPVSGGEKSAVEGKLSIMAGGDAAAFERVLPIFEVLGKKYAGRISRSSATRAPAESRRRAVSSVTLEAVAEALASASASASASGVDPGKVRTALLGGFAQSRSLEVRGCCANAWAS